MAVIKLNRTAKKTVTVKNAAPATPAPEVKAEARQKTERFTHELAFAYSGDSPVTTSRKSKTPLRIEAFGTAPNMVLTDRDHSAMKPLKERYGTKAFQRGNLDVGIANRLIRKGVLSFVSGEVSDERAMLRFVK